MGQTSYVIAASACCMLIASVLVVAISVLFKPENSETSRQIQELEKQLDCALCAVGNRADDEDCKTCELTKNDVDMLEEEDCRVTESTTTQLKQIVSAKTGDVLRQQQETMREFAKLSKDKQDDTLSYVESLSLNVPRPSAHWYLSNESAKPSFTTDAAQGKLLMRNVSHWIWDTGCEYAHTENLISHEDSQMRFNISGWYHLYFQMDIRSNVSEHARYKARVFAPGRPGETKCFMEAEKTTSCRHDHAKPGSTASSHHYHHSCVVLRASGTFIIDKKYPLRVQVEMPEDAQLNTHMARSYFGAMYVRKLRPDEDENGVASKDMRHIAFARNY